MKVNDLQTLLLSGPLHVEFDSRIEDAEAYPEKGMRAVVTAFRNESDAEVCRLVFNYEPYDAFNQAFESSTYYDKAGNPVLTAREAGQYNSREELFFMRDDPLEGLMRVLDATKLALYKKYQAENKDSSTTYVAWLEDKLLATTMAYEQTNASGAGQ